MPMAYWSGFGIFKQTDRDNSDKMGMVGQSVCNLSTENRISGAMLAELKK